MRTTRQAAAALGAALALLAGCGSPEAPAAEAGRGGMAVELPAVPQYSSVDSVMTEIVDEAAHGLWGLVQAGMAPPESETGWEHVERYALQLIASGSYITYGTTGEIDANWVERTGWKAHSRDLTDAGVTALDAAIRRDADGVLTAADALVPVCEGCHREYRLAPSGEGDTEPNR